MKRHRESYTRRRRPPTRGAWRFAFHDVSPRGLCAAERLSALLAEFHFQRNAGLRTHLALFLEPPARPGDAAAQFQKQPVGCELSPDDEPRRMACELHFVVGRAFDLYLPRTAGARADALKQREQRIPLDAERFLRVLAEVGPA